MNRPVCKNCFFNSYGIASCMRSNITGVTYQSAPYHRGKNVCGGKMTEEEAVKAGYHKDETNLSQLTAKEWDYAHDTERYANTIIGKGRRKTN